jgi:hypothetical protein
MKTWAAIFGGKIEEKLDSSDDAKKTIFSFNMLYERDIVPYDCTINAIKIFEETQEDANAELQLIISGVSQNLSFEIDINNTLPAFAIPSSFFDPNKSSKNMKYIVNYKDKIFTVYGVIVDFSISYNCIDGYNFFIPIVVINNNNTKYKVKYSSYKVTIERKILIFFCPNININNCTTIYKPFFILPRRPYLAHIYIYIILRYINSSITQRKLAEEVENIFNLECFTHSTVSRIINSTYTDILSNDSLYKQILLDLNINTTTNNIESTTSNTNQSDSIIDEKLTKVKQKLIIIAKFFSNMSENIISSDKTINGKLFAAAWFRLFSKHWLITLKDSKKYVEL